MASTTRPLSRHLTALAALASLGASEAARAETVQPCASEHEVSAMVAFALPAALKGVIASCRPSLSPTGFFAVEGAGFAARYAAHRDEAWPAAKAAFLKLGASGDSSTARSMAGLPDEALRQFVDGMISQKVGEHIKPDQCRAVERIASLLAPLPPENTAQLAGFLMVLVGDRAKPGTKVDLPICPAAG